MRIVGGSHRGRRLAAPPGRSLRPTADRVREAVFDILAHGPARDASPLPGARALDAFAGTGALGLEALSRGAAHAVFMDKDATACAANVRRLGEAARSTILARDCLHPPRADRACGLVFLDPPYRMDLAAPALAALDDGGWIGDGAVCVVERAAGERFAAPPGYAILDERRYGGATITMLRRAARRPSDSKRRTDPVAGSPPAGGSQSRIVMADAARPRIRRDRFR